MIVAGALMVFGVLILLRRNRALALYLLVLGVLPALALTVSGGLWMRAGQNFGRYQLPHNALRVLAA